MLAAHANIRSVPPATEDEILALPVLKITQVQLGKSTLWVFTDEVNQNYGSPD